jgi:hypothetical protein
MKSETVTSQSLAAAITKAASKQTYYTIRFFVDRGRVDDAYRAYGYFRWVDDVLDAKEGSQSEKMAFALRQKAILEACYEGEIVGDLCAEEWMLVDLAFSDAEKNSGLQAYLRNMMKVMIFDAQRRHRLISQAELADYSQSLATAVTEALYYFIGHERSKRRHPARYLAVTAAHITHMLRDAYEDNAAGYFNIPREYLQKREMSGQDMQSQAVQDWVKGRVELARAYFEAGRECTAQAKSLRCRLAGYTYTARFEWMLRAIERDHYRLRPEYPERKSLKAALWMGWRVLSCMLTSPRVHSGSKNVPVQLYE